MTYSLDITMRANHFVIPPISSDHQPQIMEPKLVQFGPCMAMQAKLRRQRTSQTRAQVIELIGELPVLIVLSGHVYLPCVLYCTAGHE